MKKQVKRSVINADPETAKTRYNNLTTRERKLSHDIIEAYEIALHINFQPVLVKKFIKLICKYLTKYQASIPCLK